MGREAQLYIFNDSIGKDANLYIGNEDKFINFLEWYSDFCKCSNKILFVSGKQGVGRSTFINYCLNLIGKKANFEVLRVRGLFDEIKQFDKLPTANAIWISASELTQTTLMNAICENIVAPSIYKRVLGAMKFSSSFSQGPGSPEISLGFELKDQKTSGLKKLLAHLKKNSSINYVIWLQDLPRECLEQLLILQKTLISQGSNNICFIVSSDSALGFHNIDTSAFSIIQFSPLSALEVGIFLAIVCHDKQIRYDASLAEYLLSLGYDTFRKVQQVLLRIEKANPKYISLGNAKKILEVPNHE